MEKMPEFYWKTCEYISWNPPKVGEKWEPEKEKTSTKKSKTTKKKTKTKKIYK